MEYETVINGSEDRTYIGRQYTYANSGNIVTTVKLITLFNSTGVEGKTKHLKNG